MFCVLMDFQKRLSPLRKAEYSLNQIMETRFAVQEIRWLQEADRKLFKSIKTEEESCCCLTFCTLTTRLSLCSRQQQLASGTCSRSESKVRTFSWLHPFFLLLLLLLSVFSLLDQQISASGRNRKDPLTLTQHTHTHTHPSCVCYCLQCESVCPGVCVCVSREVRGYSRSELWTWGQRSGRLIDRVSQKQISDQFYCRFPESSVTPTHLPRFVFLTWAQRSEVRGHCSHSETTLYPQLTDLLSSVRSVQSLLGVVLASWVEVQLFSWSVVTWLFLQKH